MSMEMLLTSKYLNSTMILLFRFVCLLSPGMFNSNMLEIW